MSGPGPHNLERIPDQLGYLIMKSDGAVMASSGEMENDERTAGILMTMVQMAGQIHFANDKEEHFKKLSVVFEEFLYMVTISSQKVYVVKRRYNPQEPITA
ncbi:ragulator complex protein LAMTOR4-like isoform X2 [Anneissia japonica]|uniref:ragulator complex protein LAMTOR4-like isoform X1 n=1 Tax=Anneissia japonica TaxID=1529436 RepID=UPI0014258CD0|nr:ragulator complex protein LAMTOR4-like isoform X1 [Anneissia japonica]XP_033117854.1 ragulator complex protein LAMTOR4-like isoform X1 [Anneissia japonica]XP_033117856.1 ragulator complex protein LAMTOR4-like isoform X2 [Anneissia japonica]XP_033117857.1 ragulator complex protein LAMTOR4-like isoform X2 [Anneissia japonica]